HHGRLNVFAAANAPWVPAGSDGRSPCLVVDHEHSTRRYRGRLCTYCNLAVGQIHDDPCLLRAAAAYLEHFAETTNTAKFEIVASALQPVFPGSPIAEH